MVNAREAKSKIAKNLLDFSNHCPRQNRHLEILQAMSPYCTPSFLHLSAIYAA